jgi:NADPH-dependent curcumin reductase CurA
MADVNHQYRLKSRPEGMVGPQNFDFTEEPIPQAGDGEILVKVLYLSLDPAMRGWLSNERSYVPPVEIGEVMRAIGVGQVIESKNEKFAEGDYVSGLWGIQEYATSDGGGVVKVDPDLVPLPVHLSVLGMPGMTAYFGLLDVGDAKEGDTVVISAAAGAVGSVAGQIAKAKGCRAIGLAGGPEKCAMVVEEFGFDACIDYKADDVRAKLKEHCPDGINVYFDNVGGDILDACLARLAMHARVVICGAISQYNVDGRMQGPSNYMMLLVNRARMEGFLVFDYVKRYKDAAQEMAGWMAEGKLKSKEDIVEGIETFPDTLQKLYRGENFGKLVLKVADE